MKTREIYLVLGSAVVVVAVLFMAGVIKVPSSEAESETTYVTTNRPWYGPPHGPPFRVRAGIGLWPDHPHHSDHPHHGPHPDPKPSPKPTPGPSPHPGHSIPTHLVI